MTDAAANRLELGSDVRTLIDGVRNRLRTYILVEGAGLSLAVLGFAFWFSLTIDHWRIPLVGRQCILALAVVAFFEGVRRWIAMRLLVPLSDRSIAVLLERRFPQFDDSLLTAVDFSERPELVDCDPRMLESVFAQADAVAGRLLPAQVFRPQPLVKAATLGLALFGSIGLYAASHPRDWGIWSDRWIYWKNRDWPRSVIVEIVKPEGLKFHNGKVKVAKGSTLDLEVRVGLNLAEFVHASFPAAVTIHHHTRDRSVRTMDRQGDVRDGRLHYQYTFPPLLASQEFDVRAGDGSQSGLAIEVVDSPALVSKRLTPTPPDYLARSEAGALAGADGKEIDVRPEMTFPRGTKIAFSARSNKELKGVEAGFALEDGTIEPVAVKTASDHRGLSFSFVLESNRKLLIHLTDSDDIRGKTPETFYFAAREDEPPQVAVRLKGVGSAVTPMARLPMIGKVTDDHGLAKSWFQYEIVPGERRDAKDVPAPVGPQQGKIRGTVVGRIDWELQQEAFDVEGLKLVPGDKLSLQLKAEDGYDLKVTGKEQPEGPNVAASERFPLDVVTPDQLRLLLETREVSLRKRFEQVRDEVRDARGAVSKVDEDPEEPAAVPKADAPKGDAAKTETAKADAAKKEGETKTADAAKETAPSAEAAQTALEEKLLRVERAVQAGKKNASETLGISVSFFEIVEELVNNRIEDDELRSRLEDRIARPLQKLTEEQFVELDRRLERLRFEVRRGKEGAATLAKELDVALAKYDDLLSRMEVILEEMRQLEDFNEALALLREIIDEEEQLMKDTAKERVNQVKKGLDLE